MASYTQGSSAYSSMGGQGSGAYRSTGVGTSGSYGVGSSGSAVETAGDVAIGAAATVAESTKRKVYATSGKIKRWTVWFFDLLRLYGRRYPAFGNFMSVFALLSFVPIGLFVGFGFISSTFVLGIIEVPMLLVAGLFLAATLAVTTGVTCCAVGGLTMIRWGTCVFRFFVGPSPTTATPAYGARPVPSMTRPTYAEPSGYRQTAAKVTTTVEGLRQKGEETREGVQETVAPLVTGGGSQLSPAKTSEVTKASEI